MEMGFLFFPPLLFSYFIYIHTQAAVQRLMEMGFSEDDIVEALEHCEHNFEAATAWLLGVCNLLFLEPCIHGSKKRAVHARGV